MTISKTSRRAILAGAAAIPALSLPALATEHDPIFEFIRQHKAAVLAGFTVRRRFCLMSSSDPMYREVRQINDEAFVLQHRARSALINTRPTTLRGVVALLEYFDQFVNHAIVLEETRGLPENEQWRSEFEEFSAPGEEPEVATLALLQNVLAALKQIKIAA